MKVLYQKEYIEALESGDFTIKKRGFKNDYTFTILVNNITVAISDSFTNPELRNTALEEFLKC